MQRRGLLSGGSIAIAAAIAGCAADEDDTDDGDALKGQFEGTPWHDVQKYGAEGDGETNDTEVLADLFDTAGEGATIYFPAGTYIVDYGEIEGRSGQTVLLHGDATIKARDGQTVQDPYDEETGQAAGLVAWYGDEDNVFEDITIIGGTWDGNKDNITVEGDHDLTEHAVEGIDIHWTQNVHIEQVRTKDVYSDAIDFDYVFDSHVTESYFEGSGGFAVHISNGTENNHVSGLTAFDCGFDRGRAAFDQTASSVGTSYVDCHAIECFRGFQVRGEDGQFSNLTARDCEKEGFDIRQGDGNTLIACRAIGTQGDSGPERNFYIRDNASNIGLIACISRESDRNGWHIIGNDIQLNSCWSIDDTRVGYEVEGSNIHFNSCRAVGVADFQGFLISTDAGAGSMSDSHAANCPSDGAAIRTGSWQLSGFTADDCGRGVAVEEQAADVRLSDMTFEGIADGDKVDVSDALRPRVNGTLELGSAPAGGDYDDGDAGDEILDTSVSPPDRYVVAQDGSLHGPF